MTLFDALYNQANDAETSMVNGVYVFRAFSIYSGLFPSVEHLPRFSCTKAEALYKGKPAVWRDFRVYADFREGNCTKVRHCTKWSVRKLEREANPRRVWGRSGCCQRCD